MLVGDDAQRIAEAEELAKREIGCRVLRTSTYFQPEGHVQVGCSRRPVLAAAGCAGRCDAVQRTRCSINNLYRPCMLAHAHQTSSSPVIA